MRFVNRLKRLQKQTAREMNFRTVAQPIGYASLMAAQ
jgi:hypothetical protein